MILRIVVNTVHITCFYFDLKKEKNAPFWTRRFFEDQAQVFPCFHRGGSQLLTHTYFRIWWKTQIWEDCFIDCHMSHFAKVVIKKHPAYKKSGAFFNRTIVWGVVLLLSFYSDEDFLSLLKTKWLRSWDIIFLWFSWLI